MSGQETDGLREVIQRIADGLEADASRYVAEVHALPNDAHLGRKYLTGRVTSLQEAADRIRRALGESS